jgi:hypothetical protein
MSDALAPPPVPTAAAARPGWDRRAFQGIPSLAVAPGGRLWAAWYGGGRGEGADNRVWLLTSGDRGAHWDLHLAIDPPGSVRAFDPALWCDPLGRLWLFWAQADTPQPGQIFDGVAGVWALRCRDGDRAQPCWEPPRRLADGVMMNKPLAQADGTWLLPTALWKDLGGGTVPPRLRHARHANVAASSDQGGSFALRGGADAPAPDFDEHMLVELGGGRLRMLIRDLGGLVASESSDGGWTWSAAAPCPPATPNARFHLRRLRSGRLLLVANRADPAQIGVPWARRRDLTAWLSEDDGASWPWSLTLDAREATSYPDADQDADGRIWLVWDRERYRAGEILLGCVREGDILAGRCQADGSFLARVIDRSGGVRRPG